MSETNEQQAYPDIETQRAELHRLIDALQSQEALWALTQLAQGVLPVQDHASQGARARRTSP